MCGIFTISGIDIFGRVCDIPYGPIRIDWIFAVAVSRNGKHIGKKIRMAIDRRRNHIRHGGPRHNVDGIGLLCSPE